MLLEAGERLNAGHLYNLLAYSYFWNAESDEDYDNGLPFIEKYIENYKDYSDKISKYNAMRKQMTKDKAIAVDAEGYHKYFILDGKKLDIQNFDMNQETVKKGTASELKRIFGKSMKNRLVSRVVLNKFIQEVA